jgi:phosphoglycolate phosphatase
VIRAVLFDFDFTLADSLPGVTESVNHALRALGLPEAEPAAIRRTVGLSLPRTFELLRGPDDAALANAFVGHFVERADQIMVERTRVFPEVPEVLASLRARGVRTAIVSTKYRYRIEATLARDGLLHLFDAIVGGQDVVRHKPDPEGLVAALAKLGEPRERALYVGDHPVDAEAAAAAGLRFVAVLTGSSLREEFAGLPVERLIGSLRELVALADGG